MSIRARRPNGKEAWNHGVAEGKISRVESSQYAHFQVNWKGLNCWRLSVTLKQTFCYFYLIDVDWNSIRLSGFFLWPQYLRAADKEGRLLKFGPMAILHQVKGLAHLYSITLETFIYLKDQNDGVFFWRGGQPLGLTGMIGKDYIWISVGHLWRTENTLWNLQRESFLFVKNRWGI